MRLVWALFPLFVLVFGSTLSARASSSEVNGLIVFESTRDGNPELYRLESDGSTQTRLTTYAGSDSQAAWTSQSQQIVFIRDGDIYVRSSFGMPGPFPITNTPQQESDPVAFGWKYLYASNRDGNTDLYRLDPYTAVVERLTDDPAPDTQPAVGSAGRIAFTSTRGGSSEIWTMWYDGTGEIRITAMGEADSPSYSPDGSKIAFHAQGDVYRMNWDGTDVRLLIANASKPDWYAGHIVFQRELDGQTDLFSVHEDGLAETQLTSHPADDRDPAWGQIPPPPPGIPPPPPAPAPPPAVGPPPPRPPAPARCRVPRVVGFTIKRARTRIRARRCSLGRIRRQRSRRVGRVIAQNPRSGAVRRRGFPVKLVVGRR